MRLMSDLQDCSDASLIGSALHDIDRGADFASSGTNCYVWHYLIGYQLQPKIVVEIGTRFGYSLLSMFRSPESRKRLEMVYCFDNESCVTGSATYATQHLSASGIPHTITICDTQQLSQLPVSDADLCHVDGDHSESGCYHDCRIAWDALREGGHLIVDDAKYYSVASGVSKFLLDIGKSAEFYPSLRGFYMIEK